MLDLLFVPKCAACGARMDKSGNGLCAACSRALENAQSAVYCTDCGMEAKLCRCMPVSMMLADCRSYRKMFFYDPAKEPNIVRRYLYALKRRHYLPQINAAGNRLAEAVESLPADAVVTFVPRTRAAVKKYGYDQSKLLAKAFAKASGHAFMPLLRRRLFDGAGEQKKLNAGERKQNVIRTFVPVNRKKICGKRVILIDDVVTAGATMAACASALYAAGAAEVHSLSLAHTVKKKTRKI